jgi:tetratricopeptide (TPR) repeat protein
MSGKTLRPAVLIITMIVALMVFGCRVSDPTRPPVPTSPLAPETLIDEGMPDRLPFLRLLQDGKYDELDSRLSSIEDAFEHDFRKEGLVRRAFGAFETTDPALEPLLTAWVSHRLDSPWALMGRGLYFHTIGWNRRGALTTDETPEKNFAEMAIYHERSRRDVEKALLLRGRFTLARTILLAIAKGHGGSEEIEKQGRLALESCPECFYVRIMWMNAVAPRWGGSFSEMMRIATAAGPYLERNSRLRLLPGFIYYEQGYMLESKGRNAEAIPYFDRAIAFGDWYDFLSERANCFCCQKRFDRALADYDRALRTRPWNEDLRAERAKVRHSLGDFDGANNDMLTAYESWPYLGAASQWSRMLAQDSARLAEEGRLDEARKTLALAERMPPDDGLFYAKACLRAAEGRNTEAASLLEEYVDRHPDDEEAQERLRRYSRRPGH